MHWRISIFSKDHTSAVIGMKRGVFKGVDDGRFRGGCLQGIER
jgi:hypothetical protein